MRRAFVWLIVCLVVGLFVANVSAQEIHACIKNVSGQLRIVESEKDCNNSEYFLSWNMTGLPGEQGPAAPGEESRIPLFMTSHRGSYGSNDPALVPTECLDKNIVIESISISARSNGLPPHNGHFTEFGVYVYKGIYSQIKFAAPEPVFRPEYPNHGRTVLQRNVNWRLMNPAEEIDLAITIPSFYDTWSVSYFISGYCIDPATP